MSALPVEYSGRTAGIVSVFPPAPCLELSPRRCGFVRLLFPYTLPMSRYDRPTHTVYMHFMHRQGWQVQFLEADAKTALPRKLTFAHAGKIREMARRGEALGTLEAKQAVEAAIEKGRGGVWLRLTPAQYAKLTYL